MQVNMGEGKSSVIIPICVTDLADGHQLVRVIVPKALKVQTLHHLTDRLGGLVNRPIYPLSFSRGDRLNPSVGRLCRLVSACVDGRGVIVMQPEDVLSLKLTSVEKQLLEDNIMDNPSQMEQKSPSERVLAGWWRRPVSTAIILIPILNWLMIGEIAGRKHPYRPCVSTGKELASRVA